MDQMLIDRDCCAEVDPRGAGPMTCSRCGLNTPRLTIVQRRCPNCQRQVDYIIKQDTERRRPVCFAKDLTGAIR